MPRRESDDRCPGVLRPFSAADGAIVRLHLPGGRVSTSVLHAVTCLARDFGQPFVQVTSRGNLQLRGLAEPIPEAFVEAVEALGLLPSATHERVRNVLAQPCAELDDLVVRLDEEIRSDARLTRLSGRWIFGLSVTSSWLERIPYDVAFQQDSATVGWLFVGDRRFSCSVDDAPGQLVAVAASFAELAVHEGVWNVRDLSADHPFFDALDEFLPFTGAEVPPAATRGRSDVHAGASKCGEGKDDDGATDAPAPLVLHLPLGMLDERRAAALVDETDDVVVTPDRSIVVRQWVTGITGPEAARRLVAAGFVTDESSAVTLFSACIGAPWCRRTTTPTLEITRSAVELADRSSNVRPARTHVVGCERACGRPATPHGLVVAPPDASAVLKALEPAVAPRDTPVTPTAPTRG